MKKVEHDLLSNKHTVVWHEDEIKFNAPHHFVVTDTEGKVLSTVDFQEGPIKEVGVNGVHNEDLIAMVIARLQGFQNSPYACRDNAMAITKLEEAQLWLRKRTIGRENRGVEGTHNI